MASKPCCWTKLHFMGCYFAVVISVQAIRLTDYQDIQRYRTQPLQSEVPFVWENSKNNITKTADVKRAFASAPCQMAFLKETNKTFGGGLSMEGVPVNVKGKTYRYNERSVIVICKNMNSSDIERLVPNMALSGCKPNKNGSFDTNSKVRGHCMELRNDVKGNCTGDPNACQALQVEKPTTSNTNCSSNDVQCVLVRKIQSYLKQNFQTLKKNLSKSNSERKTIVVLLPCKERGIKQTKQWLRKLQNYFLMAKVNSSKIENIRLLTIFTCQAREVLANLQIPNLAGILTFEPRKMLNTKSQNHRSFQGVNMTEFSYCEERVLNMMQMAKLGRQLSMAGKLSIVYTYSPAASSAMKLLATLILNRKIHVVGASPTDDVSTAHDDAEANAGAHEADSILYIGGPPRRDQVCSRKQSFLNEELNRAMGKVLVPVDDAQLDAALQDDCDCRQWAFQFLAPRPFIKSEEDEETIFKESDQVDEKSNETLDDTEEHHSVEEDVEVQSSLPTSNQDYSSSEDVDYDFGEVPSTINPENSTSQKVQSEEEVINSVGQSKTESTMTKKDLDDLLASKLKEFQESHLNIQSEIPDSNIPEFQSNTIEIQSNFKSPAIDPDVEEELTFGMKQVGCAIEIPSRVWKVLSIGISTVGLCIIIPGFGMFLFALWKRDMVLLRHELFAPFGLILLFLSIAVFGMQVSVTSCALKRILPSLGFVVTFVGIILQLSHDLGEKNMYTVNTPSSRRFKPWFSRLSRDGKLAGMGAIFVAIQVVVLSFWNGFELPEATCTLDTYPDDRYFECKTIQSFSQYFIFSYTYSIFLALVVAGLSGLSLKWRTQSGGIACILSIVVCICCWVLMALVYIVFSVPGGRNTFISLSNNHIMLITHTVASIFLLVCVFLPRIVQKMRTLRVENRELEMTSTSTIPNNGSVHNPISVNLHQELHSTLNKSYTNTYSSCGSFTLPSIIAMPESSAWQELCRWEINPVAEEDIDTDFQWRGGSSDTTSGDEENRSDVTQLDRDNKIILLRPPASANISQI